MVFFFSRAKDFRALCIRQLNNGTAGLLSAVVRRTGPPNNEVLLWPPLFNTIPIVITRQGGAKMQNQHCSPTTTTGRAGTPSKSHSNRIFTAFLHECLATVTASQVVPDADWSR